MHEVDDFSVAARADVAAMPIGRAGRAGIRPGEVESLDPVLRTVALGHGLSDAAISAISGDVGTLSAKRGTVLFRQGDPGDRLYIIVTGRVKLVRGSAKDTTWLVGVLGPGDQFGELSVFDPGPRLSTAIVVADSQLASIEKGALDRWMQQHPEVAQRVVRVLARRLRRTSSSLADTIFIDVPGRVAKQVVLLARRFGVRSSDGIRVDHGLSQVEIAQLVGASRETVNKALADFASRGWIRIEKRSVIVLDMERLARRAR